jgi:phosphoribosylformylglycinamidine synthase PurS subunit
VTAFRVQLAVSLKDGLLDPQGKAVEGALPTLGWENVRDVRVGKYVELTVEAADEAAALDAVAQLAEGFLTNPVIETYRIVEANAVSESPA